MRVTDIEIDEGNEKHLTRHGVSITEVGQVFANNRDVRRHRQGRAGTHIARGTTTGGRVLLIPFIDRGSAQIRPIAAWEAGT